MTQLTAHDLNVSAVDDKDGGVVISLVTARPRRTNQSSKTVPLKVSGDIMDLAPIMKTNSLSLYTQTELSVSKE